MEIPSVILRGHGEKEVVLCSQVRLFARLEIFRPVLTTHTPTYSFIYHCYIPKGHQGIEKIARTRMSTSPPVPNGDWVQLKAKKRESRGSHLFLSRHKRGDGELVGIMEARKPDRQGRPASLLASSLPRFISYCHVAAWLGLLMSVCMCVCLCVLCGCVCGDVGRTREDGGGHIGQSKLHILCECDGCHHAFFQSWM